MKKLTKKELKEIDALYEFGRFKHLTLTELKKASPRTYKFYKKMGEDFLRGELSFDQLPVSYLMGELIETFYGTQGYNYYSIKSAKQAE